MSIDLQTRHQQDADELPGPSFAPERSQSKHTVVGRLCVAAAAGEEQAWEELVRRLDGTLRAIARGYRLSAADTDDVLQATWLRAYLRIDQVREPNAFAGWLVVTLRREAMRIMQRGVREVLSAASEDLSAGEQATPSAEDQLVERIVARELATNVREAIDRLPGRQRLLMWCMLTSPAPSYELLAERLDMPLGSIGPTRERALRRLRSDEVLACVRSQ